MIKDSCLSVIHKVKDSIWPNRPNRPAELEIDQSKKEMNVIIDRHNCFYIVSLNPLEYPLISKSGEYKRWCKDVLQSAEMISSRNKLLKNV